MNFTNTYITNLSHIIYATKVNSQNCKLAVFDKVTTQTEMQNKQYIFMLFLAVVNDISHA